VKNLFHDNSDAFMDVAAFLSKQSVVGHRVYA
jgi:hypothetical protein